MEHLCSKCGAAVEEGTVFCPSCAAPQIRVLAVLEPEELGSEEDDDAVDVNPRFLDGSRSRKPTAGAATSRRMLWRSAAIAGVFSGLICLVLGPFIMLGMLAGGIFAIYLFQRSTNGSVLTSGQGFRLGLLTGFVGWVLSSVVTSIGLFLAPALRAELQHQLVETMKASMAAHPAANDAAQKQAEQMFNFLCTTQQGFITIMLVGFLFTGLLYLLFTGLGAMLGTKLFRRP